MKNPFIIGEKIYLRALDENDKEMIAKTENDPICRETLFYAMPSNPDSVIDKWLKLRDDFNSIVFTICSQNPDKPIGIAAFVRIDWMGRMATFYIAIADTENRSKGFGREATKLIIDYAFNTINLNRVQLHVAVENSKAIAVYKKVGFKIEGTLCQAMYRNGKYYDFYLMALLKEDFLET